MNLADLRLAFRSLAARPAFTAVAVLTLALGIGADTSLFSVVNAVLLRPLPYQDPEELVWITANIQDLDRSMLAGADYLDWRDANRTLEAVAAFTSGTNVSWRGPEQPERLRGARVSAGFLPLLGVRPALGRGIEAREDRLNGGDVALVSHRLWQRIAGAGERPGERFLELTTGRSLLIVGVMAPDFRFPGDPDVDVIVPLALDETQERARERMSIVSVIGRLRDGTGPEAVRAELQGIADRGREEAERAREEQARLAPAPPATPPAGAPADPGISPGPPPLPGGTGGGMRIQMTIGGPGGPPGGPGGGPVRLPESRVEVRPLHEELVGDVRPALLMLLGAVGVVLLIACVNVANLLLARATSRRQEIAVRAALGAGRWQLARPLLAESLAIGLLGGVAGLLVAFAGLRLLLASLPADLFGGLFRQVEVTIDATVLLFALALSLATGFLFGLAPALSASRPSLQNPLQEGGGRGQTRRTRSALVMAEVALAFVLLAGAGLLLRSFQRVQAIDPGFAPEGVLTVALNLDPRGYTSPASQVQFFSELARRLDALPAVEAAGFGDSAPLSGFRMLLRGGLQAEGRPSRPPEEEPEVAMAAVSPDYFKAMGIPLLAGRTFTPADREGSLPVAVVNRTLARILWGEAGEKVVGRRLQVPGPTPGWSTVVGVVEDVRQDGREAEAKAAVYRPFLQQPRPFAVLALRTAGDPEALAATLRSEVRGLDRNIVLDDVATLEQRLERTVAGRRFNVLLFGLFALLALALAGVGLYGVLAYTVAERTHEIGIRMALGERREGILSLVIRQGLGWVLIGATLGLAASLALGRVLAGSLYGVTAADPVTLGLVPAVLLLVALLSSYLPARRATRIDPMEALRED